VPIAASKRRALGLLGFVGVCLAASALGGLLTASSVGSWYQDLAKPSWNPPDWVFAPVWTTLYILMGVAAWRIWLEADDSRRRPLLLFGVQLALNVLWSALFFGLRSPLAALVEIWILFASIAATTIAFARLSGLAALLLIPYLMWVGFAGFLNAALWWLN